MTLIVARQKGNRIAIASDTQLSAHDGALPLAEGVIKSCLLPNSICVSFAGSPELANKEIWNFSKKFPLVANYEETVSFFEAASNRTANDFIIAFSKYPKLVKIVDGKRQPNSASTMWIGDRAAFELFREIETGSKKKPQSGRALSGVLMADGEDTIASELYSTMRNVVFGKQIESVGGFAPVVSNSAEGFHFPCLSDILYDWPDGVSEEFDFENEAKVTLGSSGENQEYSVSMFTSGYANFSLVGFYFLAAKKAFVFAPVQTLMSDRCVVIKDVYATDLPAKLTKAFGRDMGWRIWISGPNPNLSSTYFRPKVQDDRGTQLGFLTHCNTFSDPQQSLAPPPLEMHFPGPS